MKKKRWIFISTLIVVLFASGMTVHAAAGGRTVWNRDNTIHKTVGAFTYHAYTSAKGDQAWIYRIDIDKKKKHTALSIPEKLDGKTVTILGWDWEEKEYSDLMVSIFGQIAEPYHLADASGETVREIKKLKLPDTVEIIEPTAFSGMDSIQSLEVPKNVRSIHEDAFYGCDKLKNVKLPAALTSLHTSAFRDCPKLTGMTISSQNKKYRIKNKCIITKKDKSLIYSFASGRQLNIPEGVKRIKQFALNNCRARTVHIPSSVTKIETYAFHEPYGYQSGTIQNVTISAQNKVYARDGQCIYNKKDKSLSVAVVDENGDIYLSDQIEKLTEEYSIVNYKTWDEHMRNVVFPASLRTVVVPGFSELSGAENVYFKGTTPPEVFGVRPELASLPIFTNIYVPKESFQVYKKWYKKYDCYSCVWEWHTF